VSLFFVRFWHNSQTGSILVVINIHPFQQPTHLMNRFLLLSLSILSFNLFGKVFTPEKAQYLTDASNSKLSASIQDLDPHPNTRSGVQADTIDPVIVCPASDTIQLGQGTCDTTLNYTVTATDDQGFAIVIQLSGPASGSVFSEGISTCVFLATDLVGNTSTCSFTFTVESAATDMIFCNDLVTLELNANCTRTLEFFEVLEGTYGCAPDYIVEVDKTAPFGNGPWLPATFNASDIGKTYQDRVTYSGSGNKCWGNVKILDKTRPVLTCEDIVVSCAEPTLSPDFLKDSLGFATAFPQATDACGPTNPLTFVDNIVNFSCDTSFTRIVSRTWLTSDASGNTGTCIQRIKKHRHLLPEMKLPADRTLNCPDTTISPETTGTPFVLYNGRKYALENNSICEISAIYKDSFFMLPCGNQHIRRKWEFFDFCSGVTTGPFVQNIFIQDETGPLITCPPAVFVSVNATNCEAMVDLPDVVLNDVCSQLASFQAFWEVDGLTKTLFGSLANYPGNNPAGFDTLGVMGMALLPVGTTTVAYVAEDSCGNVGDCTFNMTVADMVPPVAHCDTLPVLELLEDGALAIAAESLNNGSTDACTPLMFKARFSNIGVCLFDTLWTDTLRFCCLNINDTIQAAVRVYDIPLPSGDVSPSFGAGHFTDCLVKVIIKDPNPPLCVAPQNLVVNCDQFDPSLESYGIITSTSCAVDSISMAVDYTQFDTTCNRGTITRIFKVFDAAGNIGGCAQAITVNYLQDYYTRFPNDMIVTVCDGTNDYGQPEFFGQDCEDFKVEFTDQVFTVVPDACFRIERSWKITNKCTYDPDKPLINVPNPNPNPNSNNPMNLPGPIVSACNALSPWAPTIVKINPTDPTSTNYCSFWNSNANGYEYKQIIKIIDGQAATGTFTVPTCANQNWITANNSQLWNESYWWDNNLMQHDLCEEPTELSITGTDACSGSNINIEYLLYLDLDGDGTTETVINSTRVGIAGYGWNSVHFNNLNTPNFEGGTPRQFDERPVPANQKMGFAIEETVSGNTKTARVRWNTQQVQNAYFAPELPHGTHKIKWFITDGCGNNKEYEYTFTVKDCKPPVVVCLGGLSVNILPSGLITLYASDFLQFTEDNCTPSNQLKIGIRKCGSGTGFPVDANGNPITTVTYTCNDLDTNCVEIWSIDRAGNADFCETYIIVRDNQANCSGPGSGIYGWVKTGQGVGISDVLIGLDFNIQFMPPGGNFILTNADGYYGINLNNFPVIVDLTIAPERDDNPTNGVTTFDLVLISKHILGIEPFNTPYKMISADANRSGSITTFDIVELRKLILGIYLELPNNTSWRFVDSSFVFPNLQNPFQSAFPETMKYPRPNPYSFVGMKVGDVNYTAIPSLMSSAEERYEGTVYFDSEDRSVKPGEVFEIQFSASELLEGCQFTLETEGLEILEVLPGENMSKENFALFQQKSMLTMAWEAGGQAVFSLKLKAQKSGSLREMLRISSHITPAEAYKIVATTDLPISKQRLALRFGNAASDFELFQNQPNPFADKTTITFQLSEAGAAVLSVVDGNGKLLWSKSGEWPAGLNTVEVDLSSSAAGVLYYKLETPAKTAVRKMVRI
jgi:hypothetical protein